MDTSINVIFLTMMQQYTSYNTKPAFYIQWNLIMRTQTRSCVRARTHTHTHKHTRARARNPSSVLPNGNVFVGVHISRGDPQGVH